MYKKRINRWGFDRKNHKQSSIAYKRKKAAYELPSISESAGDCSKCIDVYRPQSPKPTITNAIDRQDHYRYFESGRRYVLPRPSPIQCSTAVTVPEKLLMKLRDYNHASFEMGIWVSLDPMLGCTTTKGPGDSAIRLNDAFSQIMSASHLISINRFQEAGQALVSGTAWIDKILRAEDPMTLANILALAVILNHRKQYEVGMAILRQIAALGEVILGCEHPITRIVDWITTLQDEQLRHVVRSAYCAISHQFGNRLGFLNRSMLKLCWIRTETPERMQNPESVAIALRGDLQKCESTLGVYDARSMSVCSWLGTHLCETKQYTEARVYSRDLLTFAQKMELSCDKVKYRAEGFYLLGKVEFGTGHVGCGELCMKTAIGLRVSFWGTDDGRAREWSVDLQKQLLERGQLVSAAQVEDWRLATLRFKNLV